MEITSGFAARSQRDGLVHVNAVLRSETRAHRVGQLRKTCPDTIDPRVVDDERRQVGIREVAIVLRIFLRAHRSRFVAIRIVEARFLDDGSAVFDQFDLPPGFEFDRMLQKTKAVQVLDLAARAKHGRASRPHGNVGVTAEAAFLQVAVADADPADERVQRFRVSDRLRSAPEIGLGHDLE